MQDFTKNNNDLDLAAACSDGDQRAQRTLFERVKNPMFGVCLRFAESRKGRTAIVTSLEKAVEALHNGAGTHIAG